jgi:hypothetical protein
MKPIEKAREEMTAAGAREEHDDFMARAGKILDVHGRFKKALQSRGLTRGKGKCPFCPGYIHGRISGSRSHLHWHCDSCDAGMME